ncbi:hypothetical protein [Piscibacillus halophilus]|uniref:hypothetical protein n=1 Tax=Piscibacillus halophilus TaxID=571933 RepID=UPI002409B722|nr:hypothetical protein [Piscibacillus halophilus]
MFYSIKNRPVIFTMYSEVVQNLNTIKEKLKTPKNCTYHQVQLGFILETGYSRWLTNQEISKGVIEAFKLKQPTYIVGQLEPWDQRP